MFPAHSKNVVQKGCKVKNSNSSIPSFQRKPLLIVSFCPSRKFLSIKKLDQIYIVMSVTYSFYLMILSCIL